MACNYESHEITMKKHSEHSSNSTQVSYILHSTRLRLSRFELAVYQVENGEHPLKISHVFDDGPVHIGSLDENDIVLKDGTVSRKHCVVVREGDFYVLRDLESTNGTFVNSARIREVYLEPGIEFCVGQAKITFETVKEATPVVPLRGSSYGRLIGNNVKMREIFSIIDKISSTDTTVIIEGETGTGKDVLAQTIHETSRRRDKPFVVVDCSAIPEHLIESELFGHEKGSFTGAIMARKGLFEQADGGTIFLDELGELSLDLQPKLLRVLESRRVRRVGGQQSTSIDVRVIAATNRQLEDEVRLGNFREDLFYRLSVVRIFLPPLRERISDLKLLIEHFLTAAPFNRAIGGGVKLTSVSPRALGVMLSHHWPGNVRELLNVIERACTFSDSATIQVEDLPKSLQSIEISQVAYPQSQLIELNLSQNLDRNGTSHLFETQTNPLRPREEDTLNELFKDHELSKERHFFADEDTHEFESSFESFKVAKEKWISLFERDYILAALKRSRYNISHAARESGIDRKYFRKLMSKYGIEAP